MDQVSDLLKRNPNVVEDVRPRTKICGINNIEDVQFCFREGVDAIGVLVDDRKEIVGEDGRVLGHWLSVDRAKALVAGVPKQMSTVLLIHATAVNDVLALCNAIEPDAIQVQSEIGIDAFKSVRRGLRGIKILKSFHVTPESVLHGVLSDIRPFVENGLLDGVLLDTRRSPIDRQTGGTGLTHDWSISAAVVGSFPTMRIILAGGLGPDNLPAACALVKPYAVDVMTGAETSRGVKNHEAIRGIVRAVCVPK